MSSSPGFLEFFILEASEYVEDLDGLLLGGGDTGPNADTLQRVARALRGAATMAKLPPFAEVAAGVERVGRLLVDGSLQWEPGLAGAMVAAIDDLKLLLHSARTWSPDDARRANERAAELARFAPVQESAPTPARARAQSFLATEAANIAAGLELLTTRPKDVDTAGNVLRRVRALRGVAALKEVAPLAEVLEATEDSTRALELDGEALSPDAVALLNAAATLARQVAIVLRDGGDANASSPERERFTAAFDGWSERQIQRERVVPIAELFYPGDTAGVVDESKSPPTSMSDRFRLELVSQGEHLRGVISSVHAAEDPASLGRARRELRSALRSIQATAESFAHHEIADQVRGFASAADRLDRSDVAALENLADRLSSPGAAGDRIAAAPSQPAVAVPSQPAVAATTSAATTSAPTPPRHSPAQPTAPSAPAHRAPASPPSASPSQPPHPHPAPGHSLDLLDSSIAALDDLTKRPFSEPVPIAEDALVPIQELVYRGRAALNRAVEIRDELRRHGVSSNAEALDELFDLLELAQAE